MILGMKLRCHKTPCSSFGQKVGVLVRALGAGDNVWGMSPLLGQKVEGQVRGQTDQQA